MIMRDGINKLVSVLKDELVVCANGFISRDTFNAQDRPLNFYMLGSMGQASSIGLGVALARPDKKVVIFDGDGNLLMNLGILTMIGAIRPRNLVHVVFDNECYDSTGGQAAFSSSVDLSSVARSCGIETYRKDSGEDASAVFRECLTKEGPVFLLIKVERDPALKAARVNITPPDIAARFKGAL